MVDLSFSIYDLEYFLLIFVRVSCFVYIAPYFGMNDTPARIRIGISFFTAWLLYETLTPADAVVVDTVMEYAVIVMKEDEATELGDTQGYKFGILTNRDQENTQKLLSAMQESMGQIDTREYETPAAMADALYDDEIQAMILNEGYISLLTEQESYSDFSDRTKIIYE